MKMKLKLQILIAAIIVFAFYVPPAEAQANVTFSGGNGTPLTITLQRSVLYTINNAACEGSNIRPRFILDEASNAFDSSFPSATGTINYTVLSTGNSQGFDVVNSGINFGAITANDIYFYNQGVINIPAGSRIRLNAGTLTTINNFAGAPPANGSFTTFIAGTNAIRCSADGIPEATSASVSISGRVLTNTDRGLANAIVHLTDSAGTTHTARTSSFGYYRFDDIAAGQTVTISVVSKRYQFAPRVLSVTEEITDFDFTALAPLSEYYRAVEQ